MKNFKFSVTLLYFIIITHISMGKFLRPSVPRRKKGGKNSAIKPRIIGGRPTYPGEFPYQLQMRYLETDEMESAHICGATLAIAPSTGKQIVIIAAHCVNQALLPHTVIRGGSLYIDGSDAQTLTIKRAVVHPKYTDYLKNDIAVLFLNGEFQLNKTLQPLELPGAKEIVRKQVTVTGWGKTVTVHESLAKRMQAIVMPVVTNRKCNDIWKSRGGLGDSSILPTHLCAGSLKGNTGTCHGDSGGPAMAVDKTGRKFLAGVVSFGSGRCVEKGYPAVFTRVSKFVKWIDEVSKEFET